MILSATKAKDAHKSYAYSSIGQGQSRDYERRYYDSKEGTAGDSITVAQKGQCIMGHTMTKKRYGVKHDITKQGF